MTAMTPSSMVLTVLTTLTLIVCTPSPTAADTPDALDDQQHVVILASFLAAWNAGDADRVVTHFTPDAVVSGLSSWSYASGSLQVRTWVESSVRERGVFTGHVERSSGTYAIWRLSRRLPAEITLGLPSQDSVAEVEIRDGRVLMLRQEPDHASRQSYVRALGALTAQHPARPTPLPDPALSLPPRGGVQSPVVWLAALGGCVLVAVSAGITARRAS